MDNEVGLSPTSKAASISIQDFSAGSLKIRDSLLKNVGRMNSQFLENHRNF